MRGNRIVTRRIDLCCETPQLGLDTVPHELTHVVLAERFPVNPPPPWADEGMAILADPTEKRRLHQRDLNRALAAGRAFRTRDLFAMTCCPGGDSRATFYGQSASLVAYLVEVDSPHQFVRFIEKAGHVGYDRALAETYGIDSAQELHRNWLSRSVLSARGKSPAIHTRLIYASSEGGRPSGVRLNRTDGPSLRTR